MTVHEPLFGTGAAGAAAGVDRWAEGVTRRAERYEGLRRDVAAVSVAATSPDGSVRVTVDSGGAVTDLDLTEDFRAFSARRMTDVLLATVREAQAGIAGRVAEIVADTLADEPLTAEAMVETYRRRFPEPEPDPTAAEDETLRLGQVEDDDPAPRRPARPRGPRADDDFDGPILH